MENTKMDKAEFLALVEKFLKGETGVAEDKLLINYYESFQESGDWLEELGPKEQLEQKMLQRLQHSLDEDSSKVKRVHVRWPKELLKYAAIFVGVLGLFLVYQNIGGTEELTLPSNELDIKPQAITLTLENGNVEVVSENGQRQIVDVKGNIVGAQKGKQISYSKGKGPNELVYNELMVPYGKQFDLILSDGTKVKLNAGSYIKYPVRFIKGENRKVFLKGEAYFDVAKDKAHPFVVNTKDVNIRVLGTLFNLSAYEEDDSINTVLVEGAVQLYEANEAYRFDDSKTLKPDHKGSWNKLNGELSFEEVDVRLHTAWVDGKIIFKDTPFKIIRKKLERHYNVTIINNNSTLDEKRYQATFDVETIEEVLNSFNENYAIDFTIINNQIIIN